MYSNTRLLIIEDDKNYRNMVRRILKLHSPLDNLEIIEASSGQEAFNLLSNNPSFDCILLDYQLGDISGIELISLIRRYLGEACPIIMITGQGSERCAVEAMREGVFDYLPKLELTPDILISTIEKSLQWSQKEQNKELLQKAMHDFKSAERPLD